MMLASAVRVTPGHALLLHSAVERHIARALQQLESDGCGGGSVRPCRHTGPSRSLPRPAHCVPPSPGGWAVGGGLTGCGLGAIRRADATPPANERPRRLLLGASTSESTVGRWPV